MASFVSGDLVSCGNSSVVMGAGVIHEQGDYCSGCDKDFEVEQDEDGQGNPVVYVVVPIDCGKEGKFCSHRCQWQAAYDAAPPEIQERMRNLYKGLSLIVEAECLELREHLEKFDDMSGGPYASLGAIVDRKHRLLTLRDVATVSADLASQFDGGGDSEWTENL